MTADNRKTENWKKQHSDLMWEFLTYLNSQTDQFILKGGTSLYLFYGLDRFSEDLDFDGLTSKAKIRPFALKFAKIKEFKIREAKNTGYGERYFIYYGDDFQLKIETSTRSKSINPALFSKQREVLVYDIDPLANLKKQAFSGRDRIRDLYDVLFIVINHWDNLSLTTQNLYLETLKSDGYTKYDHLIKNEVSDGVPKDILIDLAKLDNNLIATFEKLGLDIKLT